MGMSYRNGYFQLVNKEDSTYIKVFPAHDGGESVSMDEIKRYLDSNRISNYDLSALNGKLNSLAATTEFKISDYVTWPIHENDYLCNVAYIGIGRCCHYCRR